jgi:hypothetical protein
VLTADEHGERRAGSELVVVDVTTARHAVDVLVVVLLTTTTL